MHFTPSLKRQDKVPLGQHNLKTNQSFLVNYKIEAISFCFNPTPYGGGTDLRGGKRGGAREHCSKKEMDRTLLGRRIQAKSTALVAIFIKRAGYRTSAV